MKNPWCFGWFSLVFYLNTKEWKIRESANQKIVQARDPKIGTQKCSTKRGVREPLNIELALNQRMGLKTEVFK